MNKNKKEKKSRVPPAKKRYDEKHPIVSIRESETTKKKLAKYKTEKTTWADLAAEGLHYKEMGIDKEEVMTTIKELIEQTTTEKVKTAKEEMLNETKKAAMDVFATCIRDKMDEVRDQNERNHRETLENMKVYLKLQDNIRFDIRVIKEYLHNPSISWDVCYKIHTQQENRDEQGILMEKLW